jgi:hypothetical protein
MTELPTPPAPKPKPKRWPWILGMVVSLFVGIGIGAAATPSETREAAGSSPVTEASTETPAVTEVPSPTEPPNLDGTWKLTACDLQLFTQGLNSSTLVGAVEVENSGNVPSVITVNLKWDALPGPLFDGGTKRVRLEPGRTREIRFTEKIGGNDVDRVQSSPGYQAASDSKFCKVKTSIDYA